MPKEVVVNIWGKRPYNSYSYSGVCQYRASIFIRRTLQGTSPYIFSHENINSSLLGKVGN